jgi:hypothetical protein
MTDRKLIVGFADDDPAFLYLCKAIVDNEEKLKDAEIEVKRIPVESEDTEETISGKAMNSNLNMLFLDFRLPRSTGEKTARVIIDKGGRFPIISTSSFPSSPNEMSVLDCTKCWDETVANYGKLRSSLFGRDDVFIGALDKGSNTFNTDLVNLIRRLAFKPVKVRVWGRGDFNFKLLQELYWSDSISELGFFDPHIPKEAFFDSFERIRKTKGYETLGDSLHHPVLRGFDNLDEFLDGDFDILATASSSRRGREIAQIPVSPDRKEIFPGEIQYYDQRFRAVKRSGCKALFMIFANSIPYLEAQGRLLGLDEGLDEGFTRFVTPIRPDYSRLDEALIYTLKKEIYEKLKQYGMYLVGVHAYLMAVFPDNYLGSDKKERKIFPEVKELFYKSKKKIKDAEKIAREMGRLSQQAYANYGIPASEPPRTNVEPLEYIAHYRQPSETNHVYYRDILDDGSVRQGYIAVPTSFNFGGKFCPKRLCARPNYELIKKFGIENFRRITNPILETQERFLRQHLPELFSN